MKEPKTLLQAIRTFGDEQTCINAVAALRWPDGKPECPKCGVKDAHYWLDTQKRWKCRSCRQQFSVKVNTIFEDSAVSLTKWLPALWQIVNCKNGISSYELAKAIGVTQKTAWFMLHRLRLVMKTGTIAKLGNSGPVECDETFVGPKTRFMHKSRLAKIRAAENKAVIPSENPYAAKTVVMGMLDRETRQVRAMVIPNVKRATLQEQILKHIKGGATVYTDELPAYKALLAEGFAHDFVNHMTDYVRGQVHTNGIENFWALTKRTLRGTYVAVEPFHLDRYLDEQVFRFNNRATRDNPLTDSDRFTFALAQVANKRLTFAELTGKTGSEAKP